MGKAKQKNKATPKETKKDNVPFWFLLSEVKFFWELLVFWKNKKKLKKIPVRKIKNPVLVIPGLATNDLFTLPLRNLLKQKGLNCQGWGFGVNTGYHQKSLDKLEEKIENLYQKHQSRIILIGWSLGGVYSREIGLRKPDKIEKIITLGSPFRFPSKIFVDIVYKRLSGHSIMELNPLIAKHEQAEFQIPLIAISTENDGIVPLNCCSNTKNKRIKSVNNIRSTHLGLPNNALIIKKVLESL